MGHDVVGLVPRSAFPNGEAAQRRRVRYAPLQMDRRDKLIEAGMALSSEHELAAVLQRIVGLAVELTSARYGALGVLGRSGRIIEFVTTGVTPEERAAIGDPPTGHGILGLLIREARPLRLDKIAAHPSSVGFPPNHPPMTTFLGAPVRARGRVFGNIYLTDKSGGEPFVAEDERTLVVLAAQAGVAVENARLHEESRERERWLTAVHEIGAQILSGTGLHETLGLIARRARELVGADLATVATPEPGSGELSVAVAEGDHVGELLGARFPVDGSISGEVMRTDRAVTMEDASSDPRTYQPIVRAGDMGPAIFVPLSARGTSFGTLAVANQRGGRRFDDDDLRLVETFAAQAAVALEFERSWLQLQRLAVLEDRERIAKELHDGVVQSLFAVGMGLQGTAALVGEAERDRLEGAVGEIDRVIRDLRNYIFGLRPGILADRQLDEALRQLVAEFEQRSGVVTVVDVDEGVASELASSAADIVQLIREGLSNVGRHAEASTCRVTLRRGDAGAVIEIDDDGKGFDPQTGLGGGHGLPNIRDRAATLGGNASVQSSSGEGTTLRVTIPL